MEADSELDLLRLEMESSEDEAEAEVEHQLVDEEESEEDDLEHTRANARFTQDITSEPTLVDPGEYYLKQGLKDKEIVSVVGKNLEKMIEQHGYRLGSKTLTSAYVVMSLPLATRFVNMFRGLFFQATKCVLTEFIMVSFFLLLDLLGVYGCSASAFFEDAKEHMPAYLHGPGEISPQHFWTLFHLMNRADDETGLWPRTFAGSARLKEILGIVEYTSQTLLCGISSPIVCIDDLMIAGRSKALSEAGFMVSMNPKKAVKTGVTLDIGTISILRLVVIASNRDAQDRRNKISRSDRIKAAAIRLCEILHISPKDLSAILDRGYEDAAMILCSLGATILGTSQRGSVNRTTNPFTFDQKKPLHRVAAEKIEVVDYNQSSQLWGKWKSNHWGNRHMYHLAFLSLKGKPPVLMKTTLSEYVNAFISIPAQSCTKDLMIQDYLRRREASSEGTRHSASLGSRRLHASELPPSDTSFNENASTISFSGVSSPGMSSTSVIRGADASPMSSTSSSAVVGSNSISRLSNPLASPSRHETATSLSFDATLSVTSTSALHQLASVASQPAHTDVSAVSPVTRERSLFDRQKEKFKIASTDFLERSLSRSVPLSAAQRSPGWFLARKGISSTKLPLLLTWYNNVCTKALYDGRPLLRVLEWVDQNVPKEPSIDELTSIADEFGSTEESDIAMNQNLTTDRMSRGSVTDNVEDTEDIEDRLSEFDVDDHFLLLRRLGCREPIRIPDELIPVSGEHLEDAMGDQLFNALVYLKEAKKSMKKKNWTSVDMDRMRRTVGDRLVDRRSKIKTDFASMLIADWDNPFKGNESTRSGQIVEEYITELLPDHLPNIAFCDKNGTEIESPFFLVSDIGASGCIGISYDSAGCASTDGTFASARKSNLAGLSNDADIRDEMIAWNLECKLKTSSKSIDEAKKFNDNRYFKITSATRDTVLKRLAEYATDPNFVLQMLHHASVSMIPRVLLVIADNDEREIIRCVAVEFSEDMLLNHRYFIEIISRALVPFITAPTTLSWGGLSATRLNFVRVLRELTIRASLKAKERAIVPLLVHEYNNEKSGVDVLHRQMGDILTSRPGEVRKLSFAAISINGLNARRSYLALHALRSEKFHTIQSRDQLVRLINSAGSDASLIFNIVRNFNTNDYPLSSIPVAKPKSPLTKNQTRDEFWQPDDPVFREKVLAKRNKAVSTTWKGDRHGLSSYMMFFFEDEYLSALRTNCSDIFEHEAASESFSNRKRCAVCCSLCENGGRNEHLRHGFQTVTRCRLCQVFLCRQKRTMLGGLSCYEYWHKASERPEAHPFNISSSHWVESSMATPAIESSPENHAELHSTPTTKRVYASPYMRRAYCFTTPEQARHFIRRTRLSDALPKQSTSRAKISKNSPSLLRRRLTFSKKKKKNNAV